jgi:glycosyltransferase involved in cell wall biosynthesis
VADPRLTVALDARLLGSRNTGDTAYWRGLVGGLAQIGSEADFLLVSNGPAPPGVPDGPNFRWVEARARSGRWWSLVRFPLAARRGGAGVLHSQYTLSPLAGRHGVTTVHDVSFFVGPQWFRPRDRWLLQRTVPASCRRAAAVLTVSETSKSEIERYVRAARGKVSVTPNALGANVRPMPQAEAEAAVRALGAPEGYVLTVGTRWPRKNMALAVEAARLAGRPIVVTGQPGWGSEPPGAFQTGYVDDRTLTALYQCAALYLAPAFH